MQKNRHSTPYLPFALQQFQWVISSLVVNVFVSRVISSVSYSPRRIFANYICVRSLKKVLPKMGLLDDHDFGGESKLFGRTVELG